MFILKKIDTWLAATEKIITVALFFTLVASITINIVARNIFQASFQVLLEIGPALVLWLAMIGSTLALRENRHIKIELLLRFCPPRMATLAGRLSGLFGMVIMALLGYGSLEFVTNEVAIFGGRGWLAVVFPVFFTIAFFRFFTQVLAPAEKETRMPNSKPSTGEPSP
ncbi:MAG: TRAP transporter small permease subunit [Desulfobacterales bacterium]|nr:TRAP transporter small permease subunit [Desulfobacterales bacterium]